MKVEIRCPDCKGSWHVDETATGEMVCPSCMTRIPLDGSAKVGSAKQPQPVVVDPAPQTTAVDLPPAPAAPTEAIADEPVEETTEPAGDWVYGEIVCPRCNLHFQPNRNPAPRESTQKKVLVVDDLAYFRQIAKEGLEPTFEVVTAANRAEAYKILEEQQIDLLVLDLTLDGCNAGRDMLSNLRPKPCPILIFTALDESEMYGENWEELKRLGADDLVIKGMKVAESLLRKASTLLGVPVDEGHAIG